MYLYMRLNGQLSYQCFEEKNLKSFFLESGTKNIIINGLSVKEHFLYQMPSIVIKLHSSNCHLAIIKTSVFNHM